MRFEAAKSVQVHLRDKARKAAASSLFALGRIGWWASYNFRGPFFVSEPKKPVSVSVGHSTVNIRVPDDDGRCLEYVYPLDTVGRVKIVY